MTFCWLDLETTGLDFIRDDILEIGFIVTDDNLIEIERFSGVAHLSDHGYNRLMNEPFVWDMHTKNGLIEESKASTQSPSQIAEDALDILSKYEKGTLVLAGASIAFDKIFLLNYTPLLHDWFNYRLFDISQFKLMARVWHLEELEAEIPFNEDDAHRSIPDCEAEIMEARVLMGVMKDWSTRSSQAF